MSYKFGILIKFSILPVCHKNHNFLELLNFNSLIIHTILVFLSLPNQSHFTQNIQITQNPDIWPSKGSAPLFTCNQLLTKEFWKEKNLVIRTNFFFCICLQYNSMIMTLEPRSLFHWNDQITSFSFLNHTECVGNCYYSFRIDKNCSTLLNYKFLLTWILTNKVFSSASVRHFNR